MVLSSATTAPSCELNHRCQCFQSSVLPTKRLYGPCQNCFSTLATTHTNFIRFPALQDGRAASWQKSNFCSLGWYIPSQNIISIMLCCSNPGMFVHCSYELCACTASHAARLALVHGSFTPKTFDFLEMRYLNDRCPVADCDKVTVTNGLFILLQATGHGLDPLRGVSDVDIYTTGPRTTRGFGAQ